MSVILFLNNDFGPFLSGYHLLLHGLRVKYCILHVKQINDDDDEIL